MKLVEKKKHWGLCSIYAEWTSIEFPCCGAPVWFEGSLEHYEDYVE